MGRIETSTARPEPRMSSPARSAAIIRSSAVSRAWIAAVASDRTATIASVASIVSAAMTAPSRTAYGLRSSSAGARSLALRSGPGARPRRTGRSGQRRVEPSQERRLAPCSGAGGRRRERLGGRRLEPEVAVVRGGPVDHCVPRTRPLADQLECGDGKVAVLGLGRLEDREHVFRIEVVALEDGDQRIRMDRVEMRIGLVWNGPAGSAQRRFLAPLAVRLRGPPVDVVATLRVDAAHVDALDRAGLGALEARLALQRPVLVVQQLEPAPELRRDVEADLGIADRRLRLEELLQRQGHAHGDAEPGESAHRGLPVAVFIAG